LKYHRKYRGGGLIAGGEKKILYIGSPKKPNDIGPKFILQTNSTMRFTFGTPQASSFTP
jgi:hypothetical protein